MPKETKPDSTPPSKAKKAFAITWSTLLGAGLILATGAAVLLPSTKSARLRVPATVNQASETSPAGDVALWSSKSMRIGLPPGDVLPDQEAVAAAPKSPPTHRKEPSKFRSNEQGTQQ